MSTGSKMIKERCGDVYTIRERGYTSHLSKFLRFYEEAKKDFPQLTPNDIRIVQYGGNSAKHTWGIEWQIKALAPFNPSYNVV